MNLPIQQISKGQGVATQLTIEPDAKVMQADFSRQASLKASQIMRPFSPQAEGVEQFVVNRFDDLPQPSQPATPLLGPLLLALLMRGTDDFGSIELSPLGVRLVSCEALIGHVDAHCLGSDARQRWGGLSTCRKEGLGQPLIMRDFLSQSQNRE